MTEIIPAGWRKCSSCKKPIQFGQKYWICSVSTCNRQRTALAFCDVGCFDAHIPIFNHRDAGAFEKRAPSESEWKAQQAAVASGVKPTAAPNAQAQDEVLIVVSKIKEFIRGAGECNTSESAVQALSDCVRRELDRAIARANANGRKTLMERDIEVLL